MNTREQNRNFNSMRVWLDQCHDQLVAMARLGFERDGRGCLLASAPRTPGTTTVHWFAAAEIPVDIATADVRRMVSDYRPDLQFVVVVGLEGAEECLSAKIRINRFEGSSRAVH